MNFGKYALIDNPTYRFKEEPELSWSFRPATSSDEMHMVRFFENNRRVIDGPEGPVSIPVYWIEIMWEELSLLYAGTNIEDLGKNPSQEKVKALLQSMPPRMVEELWVGLGEAVSGWGPRPEKPQGEAGAGSQSSES